MGRNIRPPFMLWVHPRKQTFSSRARRILLGVKDPRSPDDYKFSPPLEIERDLRGSWDRESKYALYLWPDRIRWNLWGMWLFLSSPFLLHPHYFLISLVSMFWFCLAVPYIIYRRLRIPVLEPAWSDFPPQLNEWFQGVPQMGPGSRRQREHGRIMGFFFGKIKPFLPPLWDSHHSVYWAPKGSPQESFLRYALLDMYYPDSERYFWWDRAFLRWLGYWCAPLWSGLIYLFGLLCLAVWAKAYPSFFPGGIDKGALIILGIIWLVFAIFYIRSESFEAKKWININEDGIEFLPSSLRRHFMYLSEGIERLPSRQVQVAFIIAKTLISGIFILLVDKLL